MGSDVFRLNLLEELKNKKIGPKAKMLKAFCPFR